MSEKALLRKKHNFTNIIKSILFYVAIGISVVLFLLFDFLIAIYYLIIIMIIFSLINFHLFTFKGRLKKFLNKFTRIDDISVANELYHPIEDIRKGMKSLANHQKRDKGLIVYLSDRYIFYHKDIIDRFKILYHSGFTEKSIFDELNKDSQVKTRSEIRAIFLTLDNNKRLVRSNKNLKKYHLISRLTLLRKNIKED